MSGRSRVDSTLLLAAVLDKLDVRDVVITEADLVRVNDDQVTLSTRRTDPTMPLGAYRLVVERRRSPIIVNGDLTDPEMQRRLRQGPPELEQ